MGALHKSAVSIGFYGDDLDPVEITSTLGGEPTVGVRKGGTWLTASGAEKVAVRGSWRVQAERCEPADLNGQIDRILSGLSGNLDAWQDLSARYRGRVFCGLFLASGNEGVRLTSETLRAIGERGLALDMDIYGHETSD